MSAPERRSCATRWADQCWQRSLFWGTDARGGGPKDLNATAKLPDGTESRGVWIGWMIAGLVFGALWTYNSISSAIFVEAVAGISRAMGQSILVALAAWAVLPLDLLVTGVILGWAAELLQRRMLMPREVWLAMAVLPAVALVVGMFALGWEFIDPGIAPIIALAVGWFFMGWRERRAGVSNKRIERTPQGKLT